MEKVKTDTARCKGCYFCIAFCPQKAISVSNEVNLKGFSPIIVDQEKCIQCGSCYRMCPDYVFEVL